MNDDDAQAAKDKLEKAIKEYYTSLDADVYIDDWVLVVHKDSLALAAENQSVVSTLAATSQSFHRTAGLLTIAQKASVDY